MTETRANDDSGPASDAGPRGEADAGGDTGAASDVRLAAASDVRLAAAPDVAKPAGRTVRIETNPPGAKVFWGRKRLVLATPDELTLPDGKKRIKVSILKRGFKRIIVALGEQDIGTTRSFEMQRERAAGPGKQPGPSSVKDILKGGR